MNLAVMPQIGVLRALGFIRSGQFDAARAELSRASDSAKTYPGSIRIDITRRMKASSFIEYVNNMKTRLDTLSKEEKGEAEGRIPLPESGDTFPYEGILD